MPLPSAPPRGGVLLVGRSGSGKSTTSLACIGSTLGYAADDYCLLSFPEMGPPLVHSVYATGKADSDSVGRLPGHLRQAFASARLCDASKLVLFVTEEFPKVPLRSFPLRSFPLRSFPLRSFPLRAVVFPRIKRRDASEADAAPVDPSGAARLEPMSAVEALRALAPSTIFQMPGERAVGFSRLAAMARSVPCHSLLPGSDPTDAQPLLLELCAGQAASEEKAGKR